MSHSIEYNIGRYRLTINFWFLILFLLVQTGLNELGFWQIERAKQKQAFLDKVNRSSEYTNIDFNAVSAPDIQNYKHVKLEAFTDLNQSILVENVIQNGKLGYQVLQLVTEKQSQKRLLINRGWIAGRANRSDIPSVDAAPYDWSISGRLSPIHQQLLSGKAELEIYPRLVRVPVLDLSIVSQLEKQFRVSIEPYVIRLDENTQGHFDVLWNWVSMSPEKHLGYAFQWFGLSFAFLIASLFALIKKNKNKL
ncbi:MAG: SURF1 family protein [Enterobacterales bacterium]|nr:SURF1 family protein [Enterobacterales bacterium]